MCVINFSERKKNFTQTLEIARKMEQIKYYPPEKVCS